MLGWEIIVLVVSEDYLGLTSFFRKRPFIGNERAYFRRWTGEHFSC